MWGGGGGSVRVAIGTRGNCPGVIVWRVIVQGAIGIGGNCPGGDCPGAIDMGAIAQGRMVLEAISWGVIVQGGIILEPNILLSTLFICFVLDGLLQSIWF